MMKRRITAVFIALTLIAALLPLGAFADGNLTPTVITINVVAGTGWKRGEGCILQGWLRDSSGNGLGGKEVVATIDGETFTMTTSDQSYSLGAYSLTYVPKEAGDLVVTVSFAGDSDYAAITNQAVAAVADRILSRIELDPIDPILPEELPVITGRLYDESGDPIAGATVSMYYDTGMIISVYEDDTGDDGSFSFSVRREKGKDVFAEGEYKFWIRFGGYDAHKKQIYSISAANSSFTVEEPTYTVVWLNGDGTELDSKTYKRGETEPTSTDAVPVKAADGEYTYTFSHWNDGVVVGKTKTYAPEFSAEEIILPAQYFVIVDETPAGAGAVTGGGEFNEGDSVTVKAEPNDGFKFVRWTENGQEVSRDAEYTLTVTGDHDLVAEFEANTPAPIYIIQHRVNVSEAEGQLGFGEVIGEGIYSLGTRVTVRATPNPGHRFLRWTENGEEVSTEAVYVFSIDRDRELVAEFELIPHESETHAITVVGGTAEPESAAIGKLVVIRAEEGRDFLRWEVIEGTADLEDALAPVTDFVMHGGKVTVTAKFLEFTDVSEDDWYYPAVKFCAREGYFEGSGDLFMPDVSMTRAMFAAVLYRLAGSPEAAGENPFTDVAADAWYRDAVVWAYGAGVVEGYGDGTFGGDDQLTREQMVTMLWRLAGKPAVQTEELARFVDADKISSWAKTAMEWAVLDGLIKGDSYALTPGAEASRAEAAQFIMNCRSK